MIEKLVKFIKLEYQTKIMEEHSWSAVDDCLFNIFTANLHIWRPTPPSANQRTPYVVVTGTHGWIQIYLELQSNKLRENFFEILNPIFKN